jgi:transposase
VAHHYRRVDRDQSFLLPPDLRDWLPADHVVWFLIDAVGELDLSGLVKATPRGSAVGRAAYDPVMLLTLLVYAYAGGVRSSRQIERLCREDVAYRVICAQDVADHVTIARFRRQVLGDVDAVEDLFGQVLVLAARAGLGRLGRVALDGTKIAADASKDANRGEAALRRLAAQMIDEAEEVDAAEDALFGAGVRGDQMPAELADPASRKDRIRRALADLQAEQAQAQAAAEEQAAQYLRADTPPTGRPPVAVAVQAARRRVGEAVAAQQAKIDEYGRRVAVAAASGHRLPGCPPQPVDAHAKVVAARAALARAESGEQARSAREADERGPVRNTTDVDSRLMPVRGGGFIQGYNAQAVFSADGLALATGVSANTTDVGSYQPMIAEAVAAGRLIRRHARSAAARRAARIGTALADAGYLSIDNLTSPGPDRLIAVGKHRNVEQAARAEPAQGPPPADVTAIAAMTHRLRTDEGINAYRQRGPLAEGPFGDHKHNRGFRRFSQRGLTRVSGEWSFVNTVRNLNKIYRSGWRPAPA